VFCIRNPVFIPSHDLKDNTLKRSERIKPWNATIIAIRHTERKEEREKVV